MDSLGRVINSVCFMVTLEVVEAETNKSAVSSFDGGLNLRTAATKLTFFNRHQVHWAEVVNHRRLAYIRMIQILDLSHLKNGANR